jgi:hypothetical protein
VQVRPTSAVTSIRIMSNKLSSPVITFEDAECTLLQHWIGPVLHCEIGVLVGCAVTVIVTVVGGGGPPGMAAARMGRASIVVADVNFMIVEVIAGFRRRRLAKILDEGCPFIRSSLAAFEEKSILCV